MNEFIKYSYRTIVVASMLLIGILVVFSFHLHFDKCETVDRQSLTTLLQQEHNQRLGVMNDSAMKNTKLDSLFSTWDSIMVKKNDMLESQQKNADQNLSIWLCVIAAICTILPVVLGISHSLNFKLQLDEAKNEMRLQIDKANEEMKNLQRKQTTSNLQAFVNTMSQNIKSLSDLEELEVNQNPFLTCSKLIKIELGKMVENSLLCQKEYSSIEDEIKNKDTEEVLNIRKNIKDNALELLLLQNNLLKKYEVYFNKSSLFELHDLMDDIWYRIDAIVREKDVRKDIGIYLISAHAFSKHIQTLFSKQFVKE